MAMYFKIHEFIRDLRQFIINLKSTKKIQHRYKEDERKVPKRVKKKELKNEIMSENSATIT